MNFWQLLERVSDPMFIIDPIGRLIQINAAAREWLGNPSEPLAGSHLQEWVVGAFAWEAGEARVTFRTCVGTQVSATVRVQSWSESSVPCLLIHVVPDSGSRSSVAFPLAAVSHEIRNPLSTILTWAQLGESERLGQEEQRRAFARISESAWKIKRQLDDLFQLLNLSHEKLSLNLEPVDISESLGEAVNSLSAAAASKALETRMEGLEDDMIVYSDRVRLFQVFTNILGNAIKFTPHGGRILLSVSRRAHLVRVSIADNGEGIEPSVIGRIFDPFSQFGSDRGKRQGLGLGLAITAGIIKSLGGRTWAESEGLGKGACFSLELPLWSAARNLSRADSAAQSSPDSAIARNAL